MIGSGGVWLSNSSGLRTVPNYKSGLRVSYVDAATVRVAAGQIELNGALRSIPQTDLTFATLDTGSEAAGTNYYVYAVLASGTVSLVISASASAPTGSFDATRRIGWFHNNPSSNVSRYSVATARADGDVDYPEVGPKPGMVMLPGQSWMIDIYIASNSGNTGKAIHAGVNAAASAYNATPWVSRSYFSEYKSCMNAGKRLCTNEEWSMAAFGTPPGANNNTNCWTASANSGSNPTGTLPNCVSTIGCYDMTGNVWERVATWYDLTDVATDMAGWGYTSGGWTNEAEGGNAYTPYGTNTGPDGLQGPRALLRGGDWLTSTDAGGWAVLGNRAPRIAGTSIGFRCCS